MKANLATTVAFGCYPRPNSHPSGVDVVEPVSTAMVAAYVLKKASGALGRVLGPSADELAEGLRRLTAAKMENALRVILKADQKTKNSEEGSVPPRVAFRILEEGSYSDDDVVIEYLGGVLASSKSPGGRDDRGNTYASLIARLSSYHLRTHYIVYSDLARTLSGASFNIFNQSQLNASGELFVPSNVYFHAMDFDETEDGSQILMNSLFQLNREGLVDIVSVGKADQLRAELNKVFPEAGFVVSPTIPGIELFMWALGKGREVLTNFLLLPQDEYAFEGVELIRGSSLVGDLNPPPRAISYLPPTKVSER